MKMMIFLLIMLAFMNNGYAAAEVHIGNEQELGHRNQSTTPTTTGTISLANTSYQPNRIVTRLIHWDSIESPFYNPNLTTRELIENDFQRSIAHVSRFRSSRLYDTVFRAPVVGDDNCFLVNLKIGEEQVEQILSMDTGSNLLWLHCQPCNGCNKLRKYLYFPRDSRTYRSEICTDSPYCSEIFPIWSGCAEDYFPSELCRYFVRYNGDVRSTGFLARETFYFENFEGEDVEYTNIAFGCAKSTWNFDVLNGILGLGLNKISLVSQFAALQFGYCIGGISNRSINDNFLFIGHKPKTLPFKTPMKVSGHHYCITPKSIQVGSKYLDIDPSIFELREYSGGMILDSSATHTFLINVALEKLEIEIANWIDMEEELDRRYNVSRSNHTMLCYEGLVSRELEHFPTVKFEFVGGAVMELRKENVFRQMSDEFFCLGVLSAESAGLPRSVLGILAQQHYYMIYDIGASKLEFEYVPDCTTLEP